MHLLYRWDILIQQYTDFSGFPLNVEQVDIGQQFFQFSFLLGKARHFFEHPWWDMVASGFAGAFAALQIRVFFDHMLPKPVLPLRQLFLVAYDFFGAEPPVLCQRDKRKVHMGRFLVHMHHRRYNCFRFLIFPDKVQRLLKIGFDFSFFLALEEIRRCSYENLHQPHTV